MRFIYVRETSALESGVGALPGSVSDVSVAPSVMLVCNGTGVAKIVVPLPSDEVGTAAAASDASSFGMIAGDVPVDVAMSGAGNDGVPCPGWSIDCTLDTAWSKVSGIKEASVVAEGAAACVGS